MVHTRSFQVSQGGSQQGSRKRARSPSPSASEAGSHVSKSRKTKNRPLATPSQQILEEQRECLERPLEPATEGKVAYPAVKDLDRLQPTKSKRTRYSLPAHLQLPPGVKLRPLREVLARESMRRRRNMEGTMLDGADDHAEDDEADGTRTYIDFEDLNIDVAQIMTPTKAITPVLYSPSSVTRRPSSNVKREDEIAGYEATIRELSLEKAEVTTRLLNLQQGVCSLGFGADDMSEEAICAKVRTEFDTLRAELQKLAIDFQFEHYTNEELLQELPMIIHELLGTIERQSETLDQHETRLALVDAEYKGVLGLLAEREDHCQKKEGELERVHADLTASRIEAKNLTSTCSDLRTTLEKMQQDYKALEKQSEQEMDTLKADGEERVAMMIDELTQEHEYRQIAESEIADKTAEVAVLQQKLNQSKEDLETADEELAEFDKMFGRSLAECEKLRDKLEAERVEKAEISESLENIEGKAAGLAEDIAKLTGQLEERDQTIEKKSGELEDATKAIKDKELEINKLRSEIYGGQEEIKGKTAVITTLERDIASLNDSMEDLKQEKDDVIEEKNTRLDELEDEVKGMQAKIDEKNADIEALREEHKSAAAQIAEFRKQLAVRAKNERVLRDITAQFVNGYEQDVVQSREAAFSKELKLENVKGLLALLGKDAGETMLMPQVEKTVIPKTAMLRDSGYLGEEGLTDEEMLEDDRLLENGVNGD